MKKYFSSIFIVILFVCASYGQYRPTAFVGARIIPIVGEPFDNGVLIVQNGKISAVGQMGKINIPQNAEIIDVKGKVIMPGLVDSHSHIGEVSGADGSNPIQPDIRVLDSVNPRASSIQRAQAGGITTANIMPGSGHLDSGQTLNMSRTASAQ